MRIQNKNFICKVDYDVNNKEHVKLADKIFKMVISMQGGCFRYTHEQAKEVEKISKSFDKTSKLFDNKVKNILKHLR